MRADLHVHTLASDGTVQPADVVREASLIGLDAIAITDHDSVEGIAPALRAGEVHGIHVIPGVELSAYDDDGRDIHILGYYVDHSDPDLLAMLLGLRHARLERAQRMIESLTQAGYELTVEEVLELAATSRGFGAPNGSVGRSHIARALVDAGHVQDIQDAFERLIGRTRPHYVAKPLSPPDGVVRTIRAAGGLPVLAHPAVNGADSLLDGLVAAGLAGIETHHFEHTGAQIADLTNLAQHRGLIATGGSDYHGPDGRGPGLGGVTAPADAVGRLRAAAGR